MKFEKSVYKAAMDKIDNPEKRGSFTSDINQKYKAGVLSGKVGGALDGWDATDNAYDSEMLRKELSKKMMMCLPLIAIGVIVLIYMTPILVETLDYKNNGVQQRAWYNWSHDRDDYGYIYRWSYVEDEAQITEKTEKSPEEKAKEHDEIMRKTAYYMDIAVSKRVFLIARYDKRGADYRKKSKTPYGEKFIEQAMKEGIEPLDVYFFVALTDFVWLEGEKGKYVDLYYMPQKGETYLDSRTLYKWQMLLAVEVVAIIFSGFWIGRLIKLGSEERALK